MCERGRGEETRVKVVIDGRPGLRPRPYIGQGACLCRRLPALLPSIPVFIFPSISPTQCYSTGSYVCLIHFIHSLYSSPPLSPSFLAPTPFLPTSYPLRHNQVETLSVLKQTSKVTYKHILLTQQAAIENSFTTPPS